MASLIHIIQKYRIQMVHNRSAGTPGTHTRTRFIQLLCSTPDAKQSSFVTLSFVADAQWASTGELTKTADTTYRANVKIPVGEFAAYYDLLRNEKPVMLRSDYDTEPDLNKTISLTMFLLFTGDEPLGEGPQDTSA